jgi:hypothetical protein
MKKGIVVALVTMFFGLLLVHEGAEARRRRARRAAQPAGPPVSAEISKALTVDWGTGHAKVIEFHTKQIEETYSKRLKKIGDDAILEDRTRTEMENEIAKVRDSYIEFRGQRNGWRVSFIGDEFRDNVGQSMVVVRDASSQRFYFFHNDQLDKMFVAFNAEIFPGLTFEQFAERIQEKFGPAQRVMRTNARTQQEELAELRWQDNKTLLAAIDQTNFYGIFSLRFTDKNRPQEQANAGDARPRGNALLDQAIRNGTGDGNSDVIDRITGRRRAAPGGTAAQQPGSARPRGPQHAPATAAPVVSSENDPLGGI